MPYCCKTGGDDVAARGLNTRGSPAVRGLPYVRFGSKADMTLRCG